MLFGASLVHADQDAVWVCNTTKHQIVIDRDPVSKQLRYRAWNRPRDKSTKPDLEAKSGVVEMEGTGVCRSNYYTFTLGKVRLVVSDSAACTEDHPPANAVGQLSVFSGNELRSEYWCLR